MTQKILDYRTVNNPEQAKEIIKDFENIYRTNYDWGLSLGEIEDAVAVCVLETDSGGRYVTTTKNMNYINNRRTAKTIEDIGEL